MSHPLHHRLKDLLIQNTGEVLQHLKQVFAHNSKACNEVVLLHLRLDKFEREQRQGALDSRDEKLQFNQIHDSILELIDRITPEEAANYDLENAIFKRILVVCKSAEREDDMRALFSEQYYKGVEYDVSEQPRPIASVNKFDLVVFDNEPYGEKEDPHTLLKHYLEQTQPYVLYFGKQLDLLWKYPQKAYFANSVFSLHARIEEMMQYLKYRKN